MHYGMVTMPGVFTPTEAFLAIRLGASALKFFPASVLGAERHLGDARRAAGRRRWSAPSAAFRKRILPATKRLASRVFGLGSSLFKPGMSVDEVAARAPAPR